MKSTVSQESPTTVRVSVEATPEELEPAVDRAFRKLANEVKVPGFRKGKVPRQVLEARIGADEIRQATIREAVPELFGKALTDSDVKPLTLPEIEVTSYDDATGLAFDAVVEVRPEIQLPELNSISVERPDAEVTDTDVDEQLERLRDRFATLETVARPARRGDYALIDLKAYVHDKQVDEASATDLLEDHLRGDVPFSLCAQVLFDLFLRLTGLLDVVLDRDSRPAELIGETREPVVHLLVQQSVRHDDAGLLHDLLEDSVAQLGVGGDPFDLADLRTQIRLQFFQRVELR